MKTPFSAIILAILSTVFVSFAQLSSKVAASELAFDIVALITNIPLVIAFVLFGAAGMLMILSLRKGELSVIHPFFGLSFVWVALLSYYVLHEPVSSTNIIGVIAIICGLLFIGGRS